MYESEKEVAQSCPTPSDPMDYSLPGSSIHGIFQARVLEWGAIAFSTMEYYSAIKRNRFEGAELRWMYLEPVKPSEVSQKKTNIIYCHIYMESREMVLMNLYAGQNREADSRLVDTAEEKGVMN